MSSTFLSKQRNAASKVSLSKQPTRLTNTDYKIPAKQIRSTQYLYPKGPKGVSKPE